MNTSLWNFRPIVIKVVKVSKDTNKIIVKNYQKWKGIQTTEFLNSNMGNQENGQEFSSFWKPCIEITSEDRGATVTRVPPLTHFLIMCIRDVVVWSHWYLTYPNPVVSKCDPPINSISISWDLVINSNSQSHPRPHETETLGVGSSNLCLKESSGHSMCTQVRAPPTYPLQVQIVIWVTM